jgi:hypothetical protein
MNTASEIFKFMWLVLCDRLNTRNMLKRRKFTLRSGYSCLMCNHPPEETIEHLLFHCPFSTSCWDCLNISWLQHGDRLHIIDQGRRIWKKPMYMEVFMVGAWNIWKEINALLAKENTHRIIRVKTRVF